MKYGFVAKLEIAPVSVLNSNEIFGFFGRRKVSASQYSITPFESAEIMVFAAKFRAMHLMR